MCIRDRGGFTNLSPEASITDGKFEFIAIKGKPLIEMTPVLMKMLTGEHIHDKNVLYLRDHYFKIECLDPDFKIMESTVDGELGPDMPFEIKVIPKAIPVFGKFEKEPKEDVYKRQPFVRIIRPTAQKADQNRMRFSRKVLFRVVAALR